MSIRPQCSRVAFTYYKEASYGELMDDANIDKLFEPEEPVVPEVTQTRIDDAATIKGYEWPLNTDLDVIISQDLSFPIRFKANLQLLGMLFSHALGSYTPSGSGANRIHTFKMQNACVTDVLPSTSVMLGLIGDTDSYQQLKGVMLNELRFAMENVGPVMVTGTYMTDGSMTKVADFSWPAASATEFLLTSDLCDFKIDAVSKQTIMRSFEVVINNNLDVADGRSNPILAGKYLSALRFGNRTITLNAKVDGHIGDAIWDLMMNETVFEVDISATIDANRLISFNFPVVKIASAKPSFDGIRDILDLTFKVFYDSVDATPVTVVVKNSVSTYVVSAASPSLSPSLSASASVSPTVSASASISPSVSASASSS